MRVRIGTLLLVIACCLLFAPQARATDYAYGYTSIYIDSGVVRGFHRTEVDYNTDVYYRPYVCGSLFKDGVEVVRACQGGFATATRETQTTHYAGSTFSGLSDHYVEIEYEEEDPYNPGYYYYPDNYGYYFSGSGGHPFDWYYAASGFYNTRPDESIHLGDTNVTLAQDVHYKKVSFSNVSANFSTFNYAATLNLASATGGAAVCAGGAGNPFTIYIDFDMPLGANLLLHPDSRTFVVETDSQQFRRVDFDFQDIQYSTGKGTMWITLYRIPSKPSNRVTFKISGTFSGQTGVWGGAGRVYLACQ